MIYKEQYILRAEGNTKVISWINKNLYNYLKKEEGLEDLSEIEHIIDYLKSDYAPDNLNGLQYAAAKTNSAKWVKWLTKKAGNIIETDEDTKIIIDFKNGVKLVELVGKSAYEREGNLMSNCVASYSDKDCKVYSLRDISNRPHCTIEVTKDEDRVQQIKGKGNGSIHPKYIKYVVKILKYFGMEVNENELANIGYLTYETEYLKLLDRFYTGVKYITFRNKKYFYKYSDVMEK